MKFEINLRRQKLYYFSEFWTAIFFQPIKFQKNTRFSNPLPFFKKNHVYSNQCQKNFRKSKFERKKKKNSSSFENKFIVKFFEKICSFNNLKNEENVKGEKIWRIEPFLFLKKLKESEFSFYVSSLKTYWFDRKKVNLQDITTVPKLVFLMSWRFPFFLSKQFDFCCNMWNWRFSFEQKNSSNGETSTWRWKNFQEHFFAKKEQSKKHAHKNDKKLHQKTFSRNRQ
jgi:hypothetical protein